MPERQTPGPLGDDTGIGHVGMVEIGFLGDADHAAVNVIVRAERASLEPTAVVQNDGDVTIRGSGDVPGGEDVAFAIDDDATALDVADTQVDRRGHDLLDEL